MLFTMRFLTINVKSIVAGVDINDAKSNFICLSFANKLVGLDFLWSIFLFDWLGKRRFLYQEFGVLLAVGVSRAVSG